MRRVGLFLGTLGLLLAVGVGLQASESALREQARAAADALRRTCCTSPVTGCTT
jgi:hypothetical protein